MAHTRRHHHRRGPTGILLSSELRLHGVDVLVLVKDDDGVTVEPAGGDTLRSQYVVGA